MTDYSNVSYASLRDRVVFISGGGSGIGAELVTAFVAQGAKVAFIDINRDASETLCTSLGTDRVRFYECDVRDIERLRTVINEAAEDLGPIEVLVNNAGLDDRHAVEDLEPDYWDNCLAINLRHHIFAAQAVLPGMKARGAGSIINLGSISWMRGRPGMIGYTTSKGAINGMTRSLAQEVGQHGTRVNSLVPGAILTARQEEKWLTPELNQNFLDMQALKFRLVPEHVARMALFLGADESQACTGQNFIVDGGLTLN